MYLLHDAPFWLDLLPGVRVQFRPITRPAVRAAQKAMKKVLVDDPDDAEAAGDAYTAELVRRGVVAWEGIGDAAGEVLAPSPEAIELFLANPKLSAAADLLYVAPFLVEEAEKNGSAPSQPGTSGATTAAKTTAGTATARATPAPTSKTPRKRTPATTPGRS